MEQRKLKGCVAGRKQSVAIPDSTITFAPSLQNFASVTWLSSDGSHGRRGNKLPQATTVKVPQGRTSRMERTRRDEVEFGIDPFGFALSKLSHWGIPPFNCGQLWVSLGGARLSSAISVVSVT